MRKGTFLAIRVLTAALLLCCTAALSYAYKLPDTGQTKCYDESGTEIACTGTGQDGAYSIDPMSYTDNGNGTITDNVTGQSGSLGNSAKLLEHDPTDTNYSKTPLILVHGIHGSEDINDSTKNGFEYWKNFISYFNSIPVPLVYSPLKAKYKLYIFSYLSDLDTVKNIAFGLKTQVESAMSSGKMRNGKVVILAHSMGGLVARSYMQEWGGSARIDKLITLATPHHGSPGANDKDALSYYSDPGSWVDNFKNTQWLYFLYYDTATQTVFNVLPTEPNRSDLRWDNYSGAQLTVATTDSNTWLSGLNTDSLNDNKIIAYYGYLDSNGAGYKWMSSYLKTNNKYTIDAFLVGADDHNKLLVASVLMTSALKDHLANDGMVPFPSGSFDKHTLSKKVLCFDYDHLDMKDGSTKTCVLTGKTLFDSVKDDLLSSTGSTSCTYTISPTSQTFTSSGGTGSVTVTASGSSCTWTASSTLSWATITSGSSGTGSGTATFSVSANTTGTTRTGNITVAGKTFTITQDAAAVQNNCVATVSSSLVVHIPLLTYSGYNFWLDLQYNSKDSTLTLMNYGLINDVSTYSNCTASSLTSGLKLHIPTLLLGNDLYWLDLQYGSSGFVITEGGIVNAQTTQPLAAPTGLTATPMCKEITPGIELQWDAVSGANKYDVYRNGNFIHTTVTPNGWNTSGLTAGQSYEYKVKAKNDTTVSDFSNTATAIAPNCSTNYSISGRVTLNGTGLSGVTMTLTGSGTTSTTDSSGNYTFTGTQNGSYTITPSLAGYTFSPSSRSITVNNGNVTGQDFVATQSTTYYTVTSSAGTGGSISPSSATVNSGKTTSFTVTSNTDYSISSVSGCGGTLSGSTYTTGAINSNCTVTAGFSSNPVYGVCGSSNGGTFATAPTGNYLCSKGTASAVSGSGPWTWTCNGANGGTNASCSADVQSFIVSTSAGTGGSISPSSATVNSGKTTSFTVTSNTGYSISSVSGCGGTLLGSTYTTGAISSNCTVVASFTNTSPCTVSFNTSSSSIDASGGQRQVILTTSNSSCTWWATSDQAWVHNITPSSGTAGATLTYTVDPNTSTQSRSATIVAGQATLTVSQLGTSISCTFSLGYTTQSVPANGGTYLEGLLASNQSCARTAQSNVAFITNVSPASGNGDANISYTVAQNTSTSPRSGTLTIAGQTLTVNQDGAVPVVTGTLSLSPTSCVIASGASTCSTVYATWSTANATNPMLVDGNTGTVLLYAANQSSLQVWVAYPQTVFYLKNGSTQLATKTATASCAAGSSWNGTSCAATATSSCTESESNDSSYYANPLTLNVGCTGYISTSTDVDWFDIYVSSGTTISFKLTVPSGIDYDIELYGPSNTNSSLNWLANCYPNTYCNGAGQPDYINSYTTTATGWFAVRVVGFSGAYSTTSAYTITRTQ